MNQPTTSMSAAPDGVRKTGDKETAALPAKAGASHYEGAKEPRVSPWILVGVVVVLATVAFFVFKSIPS